LRAYRDAESALSIRCRVLAVQNQYDILNGESARQPGVLAYAARERISFVAYSPLALGLLTERYFDIAKAGKGDRLYDEGVLQRVTTEATMARLHQLAELAHASNLQLSQLVLAYMLALPGMGPLIPGTSSVQQLESNAAAGRITLTDEQRQQVHSILESAQAQTH
jgi:aryl-alcohol dehydrogenase-like predicted oxidoreductase